MKKVILLGLWIWLASPILADELYEEAIELLRANYYDPIEFEDKITSSTIKRCNNQLLHLFSEKPAYYNSIQCLTNYLGDPYTKILLPEETANEQNRIKANKLRGFGILLDPFEPDQILETVPGSPASLELRPLDKLVSINDIPAKYFTKDELAALIETPSNVDNLKLSLKRGDFYHFNANLNSAMLNAPSLKSKLLSNRVLYIKAKDFLATDLANSYQKVLESLKARESIGLILDLRDNAGGLFKNGILIADLLLEPEQTISIIQSNKQNTQMIKAEQEMIYTKPIIVLINQNTASSAEILAGALKDNNRATLIGRTTYGKGSIQKIELLSNGASLHISVSRFLTPAKEPISKSGIKPDQYIPDEQEQLNAALEQLINN